MIHSQQELNESSLSDEEKRKVLNHAQQSCDLLKKYPSLPLGTEDIVLKRHGVMSGVGFPEDEALDSRISPLAIVFRVIEEYVHALLTSENINVSEILKTLKARHDKGQYRKVMDALEKSQTREKK